ncbi:hypothetical protein BH18ACT12_BH18ACT12_10060 [soil metagenome]
MQVGEKRADMGRKKPLSEQVVVIGGSYGLGRAIVREASRRGAKVVVGARTPEALEGSLADIQAAGADGLVVEADVSDRAQAEDLVDRAVARFGRIDTYIANAMVTVYAEAHRLEYDELRRLFDVNFFGGVYGYWAALPHLRESRGTFIQIASALSYRGIPLQAGYCATKAALRAFFESARVELRKERAGVAVCVILPGAINTPQFDRARQKLGYQPQPRRSTSPSRSPPRSCAAASVRSASSLSAGAHRSSFGARSSPPAPAISSSCGTAGRASTRASPSRQTRPITSSTSFPAIRGPVAASTTRPGDRPPGRGSASTARCSGQDSHWLRWGY